MEEAEGCLVENVIMEINSEWGGSALRPVHAGVLILIVIEPPIPFEYLNPKRYSSLNNSHPYLLLPR